MPSLSEDGGFHNIYMNDAGMGQLHVALPLVSTDTLTKICVDDFDSLFTPQTNLM